MRGSVDDWLKWFSVNLKISAGEIAEDWDVLTEIFQRRHLLVHNGGVVNHIYRSKVKKIPADVKSHPLGIDPRVDVGRQYLLDAIAQLNAAGLLLSIRTSVKLEKPSPPEIHPASSLIADASFEFLRDGRGRELTLFSERVLPHCPDESIRMLVQVNLWCHQKQSAGIEAIADEVERWDVRHCSQRFKLARLALLNRHDEASAMAKLLIDQGELFESEWATWPLLVDTRSWLESQPANVRREAPSAPAASEGDGNDGSSLTS